MRQIIGFPHYYIFDDGKVLSEARGKPKLLTPTATNRGHLKVRLCRNGKVRSRYVHQLVLEHFGPPRPFPEVIACHKDDNKLNNHITNLKWGTPKENARDATRNGRRNISKKLKPIDVQAIRMLGEKIGDLSPMMKMEEMSRYYGVSHDYVSKIILRQSITNVPEWSPENGIFVASLPSYIPRQY